MGPTTKKKSIVTDGNDSSISQAKKLEKTLRDGRADAKEEFEQQRQSIYDSLSSSYKQMFGQIVFAKWKKDYLHALILSPYSVPPGPVRTMWMDRYEKLKAKDMLDQLFFLIYWYGTKNVGEYYGFVIRSNFYPYEQERAKGSKGLHILPKIVQEKRNGSEGLSSAEEDIIRTYQEVDEDLSKDPSDRKRGVLVFQEGYEMLSYDDLDEIDVDDSSSDSSSSDDDDDNNNNSEKIVSKVKEKPIKSKAVDQKSSKKDKVVPIKKRKKQLGENEKKSVLEVGDLDDANNGADRKKLSTKVKPPIKKKRDRTSDDGEDTLIATTSPEKNKKAKKEDTNNTAVEVEESKSEMVSSAPINDLAAAVLSDDIGENDDDDDSDDSSTEVELDNDDDDDKDDLDFVQNVVIHKPTKSKKVKATKVVAVKKVQKVKVKIDLPKTDKQMKRKETEEFRKCEEKYSRFIRNWEVSIKTENMDRLRRILAEADSIVGNFCSSFMLSYDLSTIIKDTKVVLKNANEDLSQFVALKVKFKTTFETKRLLVPKGYVTPKRSQPPVTVGSSSKAPTELKKSNDGIDTLDHGKKVTAVTTDSKQSVDSTLSTKNLALGSNSISTSKGGIPSMGIGGGMKNTIVARPSVSTSSNAVPKFKSLLDNIMQQQKRGVTSSQSSSNLRDDPRTSSISSTINNLEQVPAWATTENVIAISPIQRDNDTRCLALEFLIQMAQQFPVGIVNVDAMARSIEDAVYHWALNDVLISDEGMNGTSWTKLYWRKVHAIVAAFCGGMKQERGTFYTLLLQGKFDTPNKIVNASDDKYIASFEGKVVSL